MTDKAGQDAYPGDVGKCCWEKTWDEVDAPWLSHFCGREELAKI